MSNKKLNVLELNNIDILGRRFNGYDLFEKLRTSSKSLNIKMLVNNRLSSTSKAKSLFRSGYTEECDWIVQAVEKKYLGTKNQLSLAEEALIENSLYKKADILHFHLYHNMNLPIEFLNRIPVSKSIILDLHDTFWLTDKNIPMLDVFSFTNVNSESLFFQRRRVLNTINAHFVIHSPYIYNLFQKSLTTKQLSKIHFINFGIDTSIFKPFPKSEIATLKAKYHIPKENLVLFCRAQKEFKGLDYIIKALSLLKTSHPITIITVTNTDMLTKLSDRYQIIDFGTVYKDNEMAKLFNLCDIFLSPSTEESFGFMAVEAMACGKPVIVFEGTALPNTTHAPTIGVATKRNEKALAQAIKYLINSPEERTKRGKLGIKYARENYDEKDYYKNYLKLFKEISKESRSLNDKPPSDHLDIGKAEIETLKEALSKAKIEILEQRQLELPNNHQLPKINYNSPTIQNLLQDFNRKIYQHIKTHNQIRHLAYSCKRVFPKPVKDSIHYTKLAIVTPIRTIIKIIRKK